MSPSPTTKKAEKPAPRKPARPAKPGRPARATGPVSPPPPSEPSARPLAPADLAALGRKVGEAFRADPENRKLVAKLVLAAHNGLRAYDPDYQFKAGFRVYCGLFGVPEQPCFGAEFPLHRLPAEVVDFWFQLIPGVGGPAEAMMVADNPAFSAAFVAAVTR